MRKAVICISGIPGSGKSFLAQQCLNLIQAQPYKGINSQIVCGLAPYSGNTILLDDPKEGILALKGALNDNKAKVIIVADPHIGKPKVRQKVCDAIPAEWDIHWIHFSPDITKALQNCQARSGKGEHIVQEAELRGFLKEYDHYMQLNKRANLMCYRVKTFSDLITAEPIALNVVNEKRIKLEIELTSLPKEGPKYQGDWFLQNEWISGGASGGNCWGHETESIQADDKPEFTALSKLLKELIPDITLSDYQKLQSELIKETEWTDDGYYGNYTNYSAEYVDIRELTNVLFDMDLLPDATRALAQLTQTQLEKPTEVDIDIS